MGGRGASSGLSDSGKPYGTEFSKLLKVSNIKFLKYNDSKAAKTPQETMTKGRLYVTVNDRDTPVSVTYYDVNGKRNKSIDLNHAHEGKQPHTHHGYNHSENGTTNLTDKERRIVDFVLKVWYNKKANSSIG